MSKKMLVPLVVLLVLGVGVFAYTRRPSTSAPAAPANQTTGQAMSEATEFANAVESGRPTVCTVANATSSMEYYLKGKMMRVNTSTTVEGQGAPTVGHMVNDTKYFYIWSDGQKQGTKMTIPSEEEVKDLQEQAKQYGSTAPTLSNESDYNSLTEAGYTVNCKAGSVSDADFVPPTDVVFQDLSAMIQAIPTPGSDGQVDYKKLQEQYGSMVPQQ